MRYTTDGETNLCGVSFFFYEISAGTRIEGNTANRYSILNNTVYAANFADTNLGGTYYAIVLVSDSSFSYTQYTGESSYTYTSETRTIEGQTVYCTWIQGAYEVSDNSGVIPFSGATEMPNDYYASYDMLFNRTEAPEGRTVTIPVQWKSKYRDEPYETTLDIFVTESGG